MGFLSFFKKKQPVGEYWDYYQYVTATGSSAHVSYDVTRAEEEPHSDLMFGRSVFLEVTPDAERIKDKILDALGRRRSIVCTSRDTSTGLNGSSSFRLRCQTRSRLRLRNGA